MKPTPEFFDSGVPRDESAIVAHFFAQASDRLKRMVLEPKGLKQSSREFRQARAAAQIEQIDALLRRLKRQASGWIGQAVPEVVRQARQRAEEQARELLRPVGSRRVDGATQQQLDQIDSRIAASGLRGSTDLIDERTITLIARDTAADLYRAADSLGERAKSILRATAQIGLSETDINTIIAGGVIEGAPREAIRSLRDELRRVHGDAVEINGRNYDVRHYAELVVRTKTRQATVMARHERLNELGLDLVAIVGRISSNPCTAFLGQVFSLSGRHPKFPAYAELPGGGPPFHPNCSKSTRPFIEELATPAQLRAAEPDEDVGKLLGKPFGRIGRSYKDLQLESAVKQRYGTTEKRLYAARGVEVKRC